ncbi:MAG TPA: SAM-dependent chlorinase/fluorinase [Bacteroidia bacterium]|nr:SAM-dependent chlorinase/fluorinase [Bacteroidia bacterium]
MPTITLTSDLGTQDFYLAAIKGTLLGLLKDIHIIDITHQIPSFDIFKAAETLKHCYHFFPEGSIHCILVNPQSHLKAPILLCKYNGHYFLGPDNGLFSFLFDENPEIIVRVNENQNAIKSSFPFIDLYIPTLRLLIENSAVESIGSFENDYVRKSPFNSFGKEDVLHGYFWHIDKFGNCISNINKELFDKVGQGQKFLLDIKGQEENNILTHYDEKQGGTLMVFFNFLGLLEVAINNGNASQLLGLSRNDKVIIRFGKAI